jgi:hypothetical protein
MANPIRRLKEVLGELLLNGQQTHMLARQQADRLDRLEASLQALMAEMAGIVPAVRDIQAATAESLHGALAMLSAEVAASQAAADTSLVGGEQLATIEVGDRLRRLAALLVPQRALGIGKRRIGPRQDGGYVMLDDWSGLAGAMSIGIGNDDGWDLDMVGRGLQVAQFDHTITAPPHAGPGLRWQPIGIGDEAVNNLRTLRSLIAVSGLPAGGDLLLKLDVEAAEWAALAAGEDAAPLGRFRQALVELHWFERIHEDDWFCLAEKALTHLHRTHAVAHVHANNYGGLALIGGVAFPRVLEVTFARRDTYAFAEETAQFPTELDAPCNPRRPDLFLGSFRFPPPPTDNCACGAVP